MYYLFFSINNLNKRKLCWFILVKDYTDYCWSEKKWNLKKSHISLSLLLWKMHKNVTILYEIYIFQNMFYSKTAWKSSPYI